MLVCLLLCLDPEWVVITRCFVFSCGTDVDTWHSTLLWPYVFSWTDWLKPFLVVDVGVGCVTVYMCGCVFEGCVCGGWGGVSLVNVCVCVYTVTHVYRCLQWFQFLFVVHILHVWETFQVRFLLYANLKWHVCIHTCPHPYMSEHFLTQRFVHFRATGDQQDLWGHQAWMVIRWGDVAPLYLSFH